MKDLISGLAKNGYYMSIRQKARKLQLDTDMHFALQSKAADVFAMDIILITP